MARINSNIPSLVAQSNLNRTNEELNLRLERLSTGLRINRGRDDPAGLIISERLRTEIQGVEQGIRNGERASSVIATTESALAEVSDLLNSIKSLLVEAANTGANSAEEREANQLQIDSAIESITRISNTASFGGLKLLDGGLDYVVSGVTASTISITDITSAAFIGSPTLGVEVDVLASAQKGALYLNGDNPGAAPDGVLLSTTVIQVAGPSGIRELEFNSGVSLSDVVQAVNGFTPFTGVEAELINGDPNSGLVFRTDGFGSGEFVSVTRVGGPEQANDNFNLFKLDGNAAVPSGNPWSDPSLVSASRDTGQDVVALVNGSVATGDGLEVSVSSSVLSGTFLLNEEFATTPSAGSTTFNITGGGALFQLGPDIVPSQQVNLGVRSVSASALGATLVNGSVQFLSSLKGGELNGIQRIINDQNGDFTAANDILNEAIDQISIVRGRLGAIERNVLQTNQRSLGTSLENLSASSSLIRDADFARETSELTRAQILNSAGTTVLSLANQQAQNVLQLLG